MTNGRCQAFFKISVYVFKQGRQNFIWYMAPNSLPMPVDRTHRYVIMWQTIPLSRQKNIDAMNLYCSSTLYFRRQSSHILDLHEKYKVMYYGRNTSMYNDGQWWSLVLCNVSPLTNGYCHSKNWGLSFHTCCASTHATRDRLQFASKPTKIWPIRRLHGQDTILQEFSMPTKVPLPYHTYKH
jgi:hypothetical protein